VAGFNKGEPLLPLGLFKDRNFSLANIGITTVGFTVTAFGLPLIFYYQMVRGLTPTQSALMMVPMALISGGWRPWWAGSSTASTRSTCRPAACS
jgi:hypothetical protein